MTTSTQKIMDKTLNLGRYSIRQEHSSDLHVGAFWKRLQVDTDEDSRDGFSDKDARAKRLAIAKAFANRPTSVPKGLRSTHSKSIDSDTLTTSQLNDEESNGGSSIQSFKYSTSDKGLKPRRSTQPSSTQSCHTLYIDTQQSQKSTKTDTSESVVISVDPADYTQDDEETDISSVSSSITVDKGLNSSTTQQTPKLTRKKKYPKNFNYDKILSNVVFVMSGFENPRRGNLRDLATNMGAKYQPKWNRFCTHLICAFKNTPRYKEVMAENGRIVREHWIQKCSQRMQLLDWRDYKLGNYPYPDSEEEVDVDDLDYALASVYGPSQPVTSEDQ